MTPQSSIVNRQSSMDEAFVRSLTRTEALILQVLQERPGVAVPMDDIYTAVWGLPQADVSQTDRDLVRRHIANIRDKMRYHPDLGFDVTTHVSRSGSTYRYTGRPVLATLPGPDTFTLTFPRAWAAHATAFVVYVYEGNRFEDMIRFNIVDGQPVLATRRDDKEAS